MIGIEEHNTIDVTTKKMEQEKTDGNEWNHFNVNACLHLSVEISVLAVLMLLNDSGEQACTQYGTNRRKNKPGTMTEKEENWF